MVSLTSANEHPCLRFVVSRYCAYQGLSAVDKLSSCIFYCCLRSLKKHEDAVESVRDGCCHKGLYETKVVYGFDCPCYYCMWRSWIIDMYEFVVISNTVRIMGKDGGKME